MRILETFRRAWTRTLDLERDSARSATSFVDALDRCELILELVDRDRTELAAEILRGVQSLPRKNLSPTHENDLNAVMSDAQDCIALLGSSGKQGTSTRPAQNAARALTTKSYARLRLNAVLTLLLSLIRRQELERRAIYRRAYEGAGMGSRRKMVVVAAVVLAALFGLPYAVYRYADPVDPAPKKSNLFYRAGADSSFVAFRSREFETVIDNRKHTYSIPMGVSEGAAVLRIDPLDRTDTIAEIWHLRLLVGPAGAERVVSVDVGDDEKWQCIHCTLIAAGKDRLRIVPITNDPQVLVRVGLDGTRIGTVLLSMRLRSDKVRQPFWRWFWALSAEPSPALTTSRHDRSD